MCAAYRLQSPSFRSQATGDANVSEDSKLLNRGWSSARHGHPYATCSKWISESSNNPSCFGDLVSPDVHVMMPRSCDGSSKGYTSRSWRESADGHLTQWDGYLDSLYSKEEGEDDVGEVMRADASERRPYPPLLQPSIPSVPLMRRCSLADAPRIRPTMPRRYSVADSMFDGGSSTCSGSLPRHVSLDDALDALTAAVQGTLQHASTGGGSGGGTRCARRSLDVLLDAAESQEAADVSWSCSTVQSTMEAAPGGRYSSFTH